LMQYIVLEILFLVCFLPFNSIYIYTNTQVLTILRLWFMQMPTRSHQQPILNRVDRKETHSDNTLFILNMSIFSTPKIAFNKGSHRISFLFDGFCSSFPLMYTHSCFTTCGLDSFSTPRTAASGVLYINTSH